MEADPPVTIRATLRAGACALIGLALTLAGCASSRAAPSLAPAATLIAEPTAPPPTATSTAITPTVAVAPSATSAEPSTAAPTAVAPGETPTPPAVSRLLFVSERDGDLEIYRIDADGSNLVQLTDSDAAETDPAWSSDGTRIAYTSTWWGDPDIFLMNADGGDVVQITRHHAADSWPVWSPDGRWLAFASDRGGLDRFSLYRVPADCRAPDTGTGAGGAKACEALVEAITGADGGTDVYPAWSPGERIVYASDRGSVSGFDIYTVLPGEAPTRLIASAHTDWFPRWSPGGEQVAFASGGTGAFQLYVADRDGANVRAVTTGGATPVGFPAWSPDGTRLAFVGVANGARDVYMIDAAGGEPVRLTDDGQVIAVGDWALTPR